MKINLGDPIHGPCGTANPLEHTLEPGDPVDWQGTVTSWWLDCPGQTPFWRHYLLSVLHLRPIEGGREAVITVPGVTHEFFVVALDPRLNPIPTDPATWCHLTPANACEQVQLPDDDTARRLARLAAEAVVGGVLPAEPPFSGQREPWRTALLKTAAHLRGEAHAP